MPQELPSWRKTDHNLDFIIQKDGIIYGCEIKNTLGYIDKNELEIKINICKHLGIKPLFIMRGPPKSYNNEIINNGGFVLIFETQIYPFGQDDLVKRIKTILGLPVDCPRAIADGTIQRFVKWHDKQKNM